MLKHINSSLPAKEHFFRCGGLIQVSADEYKLFVELAENTTEFTSQLTAVPYWKFLQPENSSLKPFRLQGSFTVHREQLLAYLGTQPTVTKKFVNLQPALSAEAFTTQFNWSQQQFVENALKKTVPFIEFDYNWAQARALLPSVLQSLVKDLSKGSVYGFWTEDEAYVGKTPEVLGQWQAAEKTFACMALAGTYPIDQQADAKISYEHQLVVEDIFKILNDLKIDKSQIKNHFSEMALNNLKHLRTDFFISNIEKETALKIIEKMHPTAALGLFPRTIHNYQQFYQQPLQKDRGFFGAPLIFNSDAQMMSLVMIRGLKLNSAAIKIRCGCGVTAESDLALELEELHLKKNSILKMAGLIS